MTLCVHTCRYVTIAVIILKRTAPFANVDGKNDNYCCPISAQGNCYHNPDVC